MSTRDTGASRKKSAGEKTLKNLPPKEVIWVKSVLEDGTIFFETSTPDRMTYSLYQQMPEGFLRLAKANSPVGFADLIRPKEVAAPAKKKK